MNRREFLESTMPGLAIAGIGLGELVPERALAEASHSRASYGRDRAGPPRDLLRMEATLRPRAFAASSGDDGRYHALVYEGGGAAPKSLLTTPVPDAQVARELREMGAEDAGGVPMSAWNLRHVPIVPWPDARVEGTPLRIRVEWEGWEAPRRLGDLLQDPGGRGVAFRFGGNEEHDDEWDSGCIACLFSCPGGVVSNERYTIRDHVRGATRFTPVSDLPEGPTAVTVTLELRS